MTLTIRQIVKQSKGLLCLLGLLVYSGLCLSEQAERDSPTGSSALVLASKNCKTPPDSAKVNTLPANSECGQLSVALDPAHPDGKQIQLNILKVPSIKDLDTSPLFILAGGPGQSATELAPVLTFLFSGLLQKHDLVFIDQRGTGQSHPLTCDIESDLLAPLHPSQKKQTILKQYRACIAQSPHADNPKELAFYTTPYTVNDIENVRKALNYPQINLWGASYGTRVGLQYLRQYPNAIRAAVLDGLSPLDIMLPKWTNRDSSQALQKLFAHCDNQPSCNNAFPNLSQRWQSLLDNLKKQPRTLTLLHPRTQKTQSVYLDDQTLSSWVRFALYARDFSPLLPLSIDKASKMSFQPLYSLSMQGSEGVEDGISLLMHMAVICNEDFVMATESPHKKTREDSTALLINSDTSQYRYACPLFNSNKTLSDIQTKSITSKAPVLLLSGDLDPATPPRWGKLVDSKLSNSKHIVAPGGHHGITALGCTTQIISDFIERGILDGLKTDCMNKIKPKAFFIDTAGPAMMHHAANNSQQVSQ